MVALNPDDYFHADANRLGENDVPLADLCGSCGKEPRQDGFLMCRKCRVELGLEKEEKVSKAKGKPSQNKRIRRVCSCGFETDWSPALGRHLKAHPSHFERHDDTPATPVTCDAETTISEVSIPVIVDSSAKPDTGDTLKYLYDELNDTKRRLAEAHLELVQYKVLLGGGISVELNQTLQAHLEVVREIVHGI